MHKLQNKIETFLKILNTLPNSIYLKDSEGRYVWLNKSSLKNLEDKHKITESIIGKTDFDIFPKSGAHKYAENDRTVIESRKGICSEEEVRLPNGQKLTQLSFKEPLYDDDNLSIIGVLGYTIDITEIKLLKIKIDEAKANEARLKVLSAMGGMIAHELRTPLTSLGLQAAILREWLPVLIEGYEFSIKNGKLKPIRKDKLDTLKKVIDQMERSIDYAQSTITTILMGFHYTDSDARTMGTPFSLDSLVQKAIADYPFDAEEEPLVKIKHLDSVCVVGESQMVAHVIHNLLKNALYVIDAAGKGSIRIWTEIVGKTASIFVEDTGKGISTDQLERIFEPFFTTKKETAISIGLGLYFCKQALLKMGGHITCESVFGEFTRFKVSLPIADT